MDGELFTNTYPFLADWQTCLFILTMFYTYPKRCIENRSQSLIEETLNSLERFFSKMV